MLDARLPGHDSGQAASRLRHTYRTHRRAILRPARVVRRTVASLNSARPVQKSCVCVLRPRTHTVFGLGSRDSARHWPSSRRPYRCAIKAAPSWSNLRGALQPSRRSRSWSGERVQAIGRLVSGMSDENIVTVDSFPGTVFDRGRCRQARPDPWNVHTGSESGTNRFSCYKFFLASL